MGAETVVFQVFNEVVYQTKVIVKTSQQEIATSAEEGTVLACLVAVVDVESNHFASTLGCLWLSADCTSAFLELEHPFVLTRRHVVFLFASFVDLTAMGDLLMVS